MSFSATWKIPDIFLWQYGQQLYLTCFSKTTRGPGQAKMNLNWKNLGKSSVTTKTATRHWNVRSELWLEVSCRLHRPTPPSMKPDKPSFFPPALISNELYSRRLSSSSIFPYNLQHVGTVFPASLHLQDRSLNFASARTNPWEACSEWFGWRLRLYPSLNRAPSSKYSENLLHRRAPGVRATNRVSPCYPGHQVGVSRRKGDRPSSWGRTFPCELILVAQIIHFVA